MAERTLSATALPATGSVHSFSVLPISTKNEGWESPVGPWWVTSYETRYPSGQCRARDRRVACIIAGVGRGKGPGLPAELCLPEVPGHVDGQDRDRVGAEWRERKMTRSASISAVDMLRVDEPLVHLKKVVTAALNSAHPPSFRSELFDVVPDVEAGLILLRVDESDLH